LASKGDYSITSVIAIAATAAIVGDNLGYWLIGRLGGRALFQRNRWLNRWSDRLLPRAERIMHRHGGTTVFFGRFIAILRFTAAWVAGLGRMPRWRFPLSPGSAVIPDSTPSMNQVVPKGPPRSHARAPDATPSRHASRIARLARCVSSSPWEINPAPASMIAIAFPTFFPSSDGAVPGAA